jgi:hypothetical protein
MVLVDSGSIDQFLELHIVENSIYFDSLETQSGEEIVLWTPSSYIMRIGELEIQRMNEIRIRVDDFHDVI